MPHLQADFGDLHTHDGILAPFFSDLNYLLFNLYISIKSISLLVGLTRILIF